MGFYNGNSSSSSSSSSPSSSPLVPPCSQKVIVFDWDDTICPSSFVDRWQIEHVDDLPVHFQRLFAELAKTAKRCLHEASKYGEVIIITNSDDGWVKFSCERYVPRLLPTIDQYRIVSARTLYERFYPGQPLCWKAAAFAHEVNEFYECSSSTSSSSGGGGSGDDEPSVAPTDVSSSSMESEASSSTNASNCRASSAARQQHHHHQQQERREVISFGDSVEERTAVRIVADQLSAIPKSVMFIPTPTVPQLVGQLHMVANHMPFVCEHASGALDLEISPDQAERCAESYMRRNRLQRDLQAVLRDDLNKHMLFVPETTTTTAMAASGATTTNRCGNDVAVVSASSSA